MELIIILILSIIILLLTGIIIYLYVEFKKIKDEGEGLVSTIEALNEYKDFSEVKFRDLYDAFILLKQTGLQNINGHPYMGSDEVIKAFLQSVFQFEPKFFSLLTEIQNKLGDLFGTEQEEEK